MESFLNRVIFGLNFINFTNFKGWIFENERVVAYRNSDIREEMAKAGKFIKREYLCKQVHGSG